MKLTCLLLALLVSTVSAKVYFEEKFDDSWDKRWVISDWKKDEGSAGSWRHTAGKHYGDEKENKGVQTYPDARFYAMSSAMPEKFSNEGKDLVLQFSVKHEQKLDCGGGYIKLLPDGIDQKKFGGDTDYAIMFGPDVCGATKRVHVIFTYKGKNLLTKKTIPCETDTATHVYTLVVKPDNTYQVLIDNEVKESGSLYDDWDFLAPKEIRDPDAKKPEDWDDRARIPDPSDVKPEGWDDIPAEIADPEASKPEDWDDEEDGEWAPPMIPNPDYKGPWVQKQMDNPDYKGRWEAPMIPNPEFQDDPNIYLFKDLKYVGFELWQVKSGSIFDNIMVTDDAAVAKKFAEDTWGKTKAGEKAMMDAEEEEERKKREEEMKRMDEERAKLGEDEDEEDEDEDEDFDDEEEDEEEDYNAKDEL
eukprot:jgi/Mesvir1/12358/Mv00541-RA.1